MALLDFEQYPDYAMKTNRKGERVREPWASGPSPLAMALMAGGFGMMGDGTTEWVGGGGNRWDDFRRGGLLGVQAFGQGHRDLQGQRKDFYTQANALEDQLIQNQQAKRDHEESIRLRRLRENRDKSFPELLKMLTDSDRPEVQMAVPKLQLLYATSREKGVAAAMNIVSQLKTTPSAVEVKPIIDQEGNPTGHSYITQNGEYKTTVKTGTDSVGDLKLDTKTLNGILYQATQPDSKMTPVNYRRYYKMLQQNGLVKGVVKEGEKEKMGMFAGPLAGFPTPWEFGKSRNMSEEAMTKLGWEKDPSIEQWMQEGSKLPGSEAAKSGYKFGQIMQSEEDIKELAKVYPKFDHSKTKPASAGDWIQYMLRGLSANPFEGPARSAENIYMGGAQGFAYLFSGATVRAEELTQFRVIMYPVPGDSQFDVKRKARRRKRIMDLYNSTAPDSMKQAYDVANQASIEDGKGPLKTKLKRKKKVENVEPKLSKEEIAKKAFE